MQPSTSPTSPSAPAMQVPGNEEQQSQHVKPKRPRRAQLLYRLRLTELRSVVVACVIAATTASAQTDSTLRPAQPDPRTTHNAQAHGTGWVMFDDNIAREMNLSNDQLRRVQEVDSRYAGDYKALGEDPTKNPRYRELSDRRDTDLRGIMTSEQFNQWSQRNSAPTAVPPSRQNTAPQRTP